MTESKEIDCRIDQALGIRPHATLAGSGIIFGGDKHEVRFMGLTPTEEGARFYGKTEFMGPVRFDEQVDFGDADITGLTIGQATLILWRTIRSTVMK